MENNVKILLLKIIKFNGDINPLLKLGYDYAQIVALIKNEIELGNAVRKNGLLQLTDSGDALIEKIIKVQGREDLSIWIEPENESKIPKIPIDSIFLPNQNELTFKLG